MNSSNLPKGNFAHYNESSEMFYICIYVKISQCDILKTCIAIPFIFFYYRVIWLNNSFVHWQKMSPVKESKTNKRYWKLHCIFNLDRCYVCKNYFFSDNFKISEKKKINKLKGLFFKGHFWNPTSICTYLYCIFCWVWYYFSLSDKELL